MSSSEKKLSADLNSSQERSHEAGQRGTISKTANTGHIQALIFDFGGVIDYPPDTPAWQKGFRDLGAKYDIALDKEPFKTLISDYAIGKFQSDQAFLSVLREKLGIPTEVDDKAVIAAWNGQSTKINSELYKLMEYRKLFKLFALSNTNKLFRDFCESVTYLAHRKHPINKDLPENYRHIFDKVYYSYEVGFRKPDPQIWQLVLKDHSDLKPSQFVFIDDILEYVEVARKLGMHAFHFDINKHSYDDVIQFVNEVNAKMARGNERKESKEDQGKASEASKANETSKASEASVQKVSDVKEVSERSAATTDSQQKPAMTYYADVTAAATSASIGGAVTSTGTSSSNTVTSSSITVSSTTPVPAKKK